uniref:DUF7841 domain-containing protein n=1 Tax=Geladintestivirus 1 TaxID=3233133 RepID=A0AAU8MHX9_9CAUD
MIRDSLDLYDDMPESMIKYYKHYGRHFNRKLLEFAISKMKKQSLSTGEVTKIKPYTKEEVDALLTAHHIELNNNELLDYVYVANMCKADFLNKSVPTEEHLTLYIKDVIDDADGYDGMVFNRWYADMCRQGIPIDWDNML